jgi:hypothetical protein
MTEQWGVVWYWAEWVALLGAPCLAVALLRWSRFRDWSGRLFAHFLPAWLCTPVYDRMTDHAARTKYQGTLSYDKVPAQGVREHWVATFDTRPVRPERRVRGEPAAEPRGETE